MISTYPNIGQHPHAVALFNDGADSFSLPLGSTLEELAIRIEALGERHAGVPVAIQVQFDRPAGSHSQH